MGQSSPDTVAEKLCALWIDDLYVPGLRFRDGMSLKADRTEAALRTFEAQFSNHELELFEQFHRFLELRLEMLPKRLQEERVFPRGEFWQAIISHARRILEEIDPEGLELDEITESSRKMLWGER